MARCEEFIRQHFRRNYYCDCTMVTNQTNRVVGYATGPLFCRREGNKSILQAPEELAPGLTHLFSDRNWDPGRADETGIRIEARMGADEVSITLTAMSWGNVKTEVEVIDCDADVLYGVGTGVGAHIPQAIYLISLGEPYQIID